MKNEVKWLVYYWFIICIVPCSKKGIRRQGCWSATPLQVLRSSCPLIDTGLRDAVGRLQDSFGEEGVLRKAVASCPTSSSISLLVSPISGVTQKLVGRLQQGKVSSRAGRLILRGTPFHHSSLWCWLQGKCQVFSRVLWLGLGSPQRTAGLVSLREAQC